MMTTAWFLLTVDGRAERVTRALADGRAGRAGRGAAGEEGGPDTGPEWPPGPLVILAIGKAYSTSPLCSLATYVVVCIVTIWSRLVRYNTSLYVHRKLLILRW